VLLFGNWHVARVDVFLIFFGPRKFSSTYSSCRVIDLGGSDWTAVNNNGSFVVNGGTVPGDIVTDLWRAGFIGDPYYRYNDITYRWIGLDNWTYSKTFVIQQSFLSNRKVSLLSVPRRPSLTRATDHSALRRHRYNCNSDH